MAHFRMYAVLPGYPIIPFFGAEEDSAGTPPYAAAAALLLPHSIGPRGSGQVGTATGRSPQAAGLVSGGLTGLKPEVQFAASTVVV